MNSRQPKQRIEFGDWQTPFDLSQQVVEIVANSGFRPASILEPTCGRGVFIETGAQRFPTAQAIGFDINPTYVEEARHRNPHARIEVGDFFALQWESILEELPKPILIIGNPPWVTSAGLGAIGSQNLPAKSNVSRLGGLDAKTGKANFDVAEWMLLHLAHALQKHEFFLAMLCKASVARRLMQHMHRLGWKLEGATYGIDARTHFQAAVDAVLLTLSSVRHGNPSIAAWRVYDSLASRSPTRLMGLVDGHVSSDVAQFEATRKLEGTCSPAWRSGMKHDCARVMELLRKGSKLINGFGEEVDLEDELVFPLLKGSDISNDRAAGNRFVLVPQKRLGEDTAVLQARAPKTWAYLNAHKGLLKARKSSIYRGKPAFSVFGIGEYSFCPYKVAICGLYKRLDFKVVEPYQGRPVLLDDTCYFLPCSNGDEATRIAAALNGEQAKRFFEARVFWTEKRPISKSLLQSLSIDTLLRT